MHSHFSKSAARSETSYEHMRTSDEVLNFVTEKLSQLHFPYIRNGRWASLGPVCKTIKHYRVACLIQLYS